MIGKSAFPLREGAVSDREHRWTIELHNQHPIDATESVADALIIRASAIGELQEFG
jgi:hypothetical protein